MEESLPDVYNTQGRTSVVNNPHFFSKFVKFVKCFSSIRFRLMLALLSCPYRCVIDSVRPDLLRRSDTIQLVTRDHILCMSIRRFLLVSRASF